MKYRIKNWTDYQHYKDRCPPWIKLHNSLLTSEVWVMGNDACRTLSIACMLLASRNEANDGTFNGDPEYVKRFAYLNSKPDFKPLIDNGFIELVQDASAMLDECNTEKRREEQSREEKEKRKTPATQFVLPDWINQEHWNMWIKSRKKMTPEQMNAQVDKLRKWKDAGLPYAQSLENSATNGYQGLFEPKSNLKLIPQSDNDQIREKARARIFGEQNETI